ncbi:hypothetical protein BP5796_03888 [Coleophoma crateriformis]|uniref:Uncharacterized protein n=1 Tax=Coleophoma crateriformis TaxID=565419 RepID=A0A3D8SGZ0_9HELO|nr:hypothetical protein BP5796_03888 [Coleophoma crateriformis]
MARSQPLSSRSMLPFYLHLFLETPAALNFFFNPGQQLGLSESVPQAEAVVRQYAVLLLSSNLVALAMICRPSDGTTQRVSGALGIYHVAPLVRAVGKIWAGQVSLSSGLGGPWVHAFGHAIALFLLLSLYLKPIIPR